MWEGELLCATKNGNVIPHAKVIATAALLQKPDLTTQLPMKLETSKGQGSGVSGNPKP